MNFKFRYNALLSYRKRLKEVAEIELSHAQLELKQNNERLLFLNKELQEAQYNLATGLKERISSSLLINCSEHINSMKIKIIRQKMMIINSEKIVEKKMKNVIEKTKQYKVIEKLREKDLKKWNYHQHLMEEKELSEAAIVRFGKEFI